MDPSIYICFKRSGLIPDINEVKKNEFQNTEDVTEQEAGSENKLVQLPATPLDLVGVFEGASNQNADDDELHHYYQLGNSIFKQYTSVIMANLDALSFATQHYNGSLKFQADDSNINMVQYQNENIKNLLSCCLVNEYSGGAADYISYRKPEAVFYGINSTATQNFYPINTSKDQDIKTNWKAMVAEIQRSQALGLDLVVDFGPDLESSYRLTLAIYLLKNKSTWICRLKELDYKLLYLTSLFFETIIIYRLMSTSSGDDHNFTEKESDNPLIERNWEANTDMYLIAKNKKYKTEKLTEILDNWREKDEYKLQFSDDFLKYMDDTINQINSFKLRNEIDIYLPFIIWNIPDNKIV